MKVNIIYGVSNFRESAQTSIRASLEQEGIEVVDDRSVRDIKSGIDQEVEDYSSEIDLVLIISHRLEEKNPFLIDDLVRYQKAVHNIKIIVIVDNDARGTEFMKALSDNGIYLALYGKDTSPTTIAKMINAGRSVQDAKKYYGVDDKANITKSLTVESALIHINKPVRNPKEYFGRARFVRDKLASEDLFTVFMKRLPDEIKDVLATDKTYYPYVEDYVIAKNGTGFSPNDSKNQKEGGLFKSIFGKKDNSRESKEAREAREISRVVDNINDEAERRAEEERKAAEVLAEKKRLEEEKKAELERAEREERDRQAELERKEQERAERAAKEESLAEERKIKEAQRAEQERLNAEKKAEEEAAAREKAEADLAEKERIAKEKADREEAERIRREEERIRREEEKARKAREKAERDRELREMNEEIAMRNKALAEAKAKEDRERQEKIRIEAEAKARVEAEARREESMFLSPGEVKNVVRSAIRRTVIGVAGAQRHVGCTHQALLIGNMLSNMGFKVAIVEDYNQTDKVFDMVADENGVNANGEMFSVRGVDYYPCFSLKQLPTLNAKNYNFVIVDFGLFDEDMIEEYGRCSVQVLVSGSRFWEVRQIQKVFRSVSMEQIMTYNFLFIGTPEAKKDSLKKDLLPIKTVFFGEYEPNPYATTGYAALNEILADFMVGDDGVKKKSTGLLGMFRK